MTGKPKIVLLGMLTKMPVGGVAWLVGQYVLGFERLGFEVYYVEAHARTPSMFITDACDDGTEGAADYLGGIMERFGLRDRWALHALHADGRCIGMTTSQLTRLYDDAALIINMHGGTVPLPEHGATGRLVLLSTDPVELELEIHRGCRRALEFLEQHVAYFTWGLNYGNPDCLLPWAHDYQFIPSPPPIVLDLWSNDIDPHNRPLTTIGNWRQDWREVSYDGERYGWSKHEEFLKVIDLPSRVDTELELALSSVSDSDRSLLRSHGWQVVDGLAASQAVNVNRANIARSRGEFSVAKDQNVRLRSGWFSERSACYLASGRPVIMQETGFANALPTGEGLIPFVDTDTAAAAVEAVLSNADRHRRAARDIAASHLSYDVVLPAMLRHLGLPVPVRGSNVAGSRSQAAGSMPLPLSVRLVPTSRRPLRLDDVTAEAMLNRPVPMVTLSEVRPCSSLVMAVLDNLVVTRMALESVLANTTGAYELIVVDNGSRPVTRQYLSVLAARNAHVRVLRNDENQGFAPAINQALAVARGDIFVLLNNDIVAPPGWLDGLTELLNVPDVGLVGPATNRCGNEAQIPTSYTTYGEMLSFVEERAATPKDHFEIPVATMFCAAMRRDTYEAVGHLDERFEIGLFEDDDYSRRVRSAGLRVLCLPGVFVHHFGEASLGQLAADGVYGPLFEANKCRYED